MEWIRENWVFILLAIICIAMHLFGHGRHRGHGVHSDEGEERKGHSEKRGGHGCC